MTINGQSQAQGRRVKAFAAQNGGDPASVGRTIGFSQDAEFRGGRENPAFRLH